MSTTNPNSQTFSSALHSLKDHLDGKHGYEHRTPVLPTSEANALLGDAVARARHDARHGDTTSIELLFFPDGTAAAVRAIAPDEVIIAVLTADEAQNIQRIIEGKANEGEVSP